MASYPLLRYHIGARAQVSDKELKSDLGSLQPPQILCNPFKLSVLQEFHI